MKKTVERAIMHALGALGIEVPAGGVEVEITRSGSFGDISTPLAMGLSRALRKPPREVASQIVENLPPEDAFEKVEVAGPGFINFTFKAGFLHGRLGLLLREGRAFLREDIGGGRKVQVEYVSANPTGPLHLGHARGAAVGNALSKLLSAAGFEVTREYYINDAGRQVRLLANSAFAKYKHLLGVDYSFPAEGYMGGYVEDISKTAIERFGERYRDAGFEEAEGSFADLSLELMLRLIREDLDFFGVEFDEWQSERELFSSGAVSHAIDFLRGRGHIFESEGALWFRATSFGDEKDRVVIKSGGEHTYFASDIAYHLRKVEKGFEEIIDIWGADHHGYVPRLSAVMDALGCESGRLKVLLVQMVSLSRSGKPVLMSKRAGEYVTLREVAEEVGPDIAKFIFLTRRHDSHLVFDLDAAKAASAENPVYYVQYANARINSIFAHAGEGPGEGREAADLALLVKAEESVLIKKLLAYPILFKQAARALEPHRITFYLQELAGLFHRYYNRHRVVSDDPALTGARLALCSAVRAVLREGLETLGLTAPERM